MRALDAPSSEGAARYTNYAPSETSAPLEPDEGYQGAQRDDREANTHRNDDNVALQRRRNFCYSPVMPLAGMTGGRKSITHNGRPTLLLSP